MTSSSSGGQNGPAARVDADDPVVISAPADAIATANANATETATESHGATSGDGPAPATMPTGTAIAAAAEAANPEEVAAADSAAPAPATEARPSTPPPPQQPPQATANPNDENLPDASSSAQPGLSTPIAQQSQPVMDELMPDAPAVPVLGGASDVAQEHVATHQQHQQYQQQSAANIMTTSAEQYAPSTPFTPAPMSSLDQQHAYMMMALASMSGPVGGMSPPPTVTPSQVTLPQFDSRRIQ